AAGVLARDRRRRPPRAAGRAVPRGARARRRARAAGRGARPRAARALRRGLRRRRPAAGAGGARRADRRRLGPPPRRRGRHRTRPGRGAARRPHGRRALARAGDGILGSLAEALSRPATEVAPLLLGAVLHGRGASVRITEVEAYLGGE